MRNISIERGPCGLLILTAVFLFIILFAAGCSADNAEPLRVVGDVESEYRIEAGESVTLDSLIRKAKADGTVTAIYLCGDDGLCSAVGLGDERTAEEAGLGGITISYDDEYLWHVSAPDYPPSTEVKDLARIILVAEGSSTGLDIDGERRSMGEILTSDLTRLGIVEGSSGSGDYVSRVIKYRDAFRIAGALVITGGDGGRYLVDGDSGWFVLKGERIDFLDESKEVYEGIETVVSR